MFPREYTGQFAESDIYIDCYNKGRVFYFGNRILQFYTPYLRRGRNIIKAVEDNLGDWIISDVEETDSEILFKFPAKCIKELEPYIKPKTNGSGISPFSTKNIPKSKYIIPDKDLLAYKNIIGKIPKKHKIAILHMTKHFLELLETKKNSWDKIKADMALKGLKGKEYIHGIGQWDNYITFLQENIKHMQDERGTKDEKDGKVL